MTRAFGAGWYRVDPDGRKMILGKTGLPILFCPALTLPEAIFPSLSLGMCNCPLNLQIS